MSLIRWSPYVDMFNDMDDVVSHLPSLSNQHMFKSFMPAVNMYETDAELIVEVQLPGMKAEQVEVTVEQGVLMIKGNSPTKEREIEEKNYHLREVRSGSFSRAITLPTAVEEGMVSASFENGILKITCPKVQPVTPKKIAIKINEQK